MEALTVALDKKFGIYVCEENTVVLDGSIRVPIQVHSELPDIGKLTKVVERYGYRLVSENDGSDNLNLYLQTKQVERGATYRYWTSIIVDFVLILTAIYMIYARTHI